MRPCRTRTIRSSKSSAAFISCSRSCIRQYTKSWKNGDRRESPVLLEGQKPRQAARAHVASGRCPGGGNVGARAVLRRHRRRQGLGPRRFRHKVQRHGLFPGVRGAAAGRVRPRAGRVPLVLLYGGVRRARRRQARGRAASAWREAVPRLRRGRRHHLRAHRRHSWEFRHARRV